MSAPTHVKRFRGVTYACKEWDEGPLRTRRVRLTGREVLPGGPEVPQAIMRRAGGRWSAWAGSTPLGGEWLAESDTYEAAMEKVLAYLQAADARLRLGAAV